MNDEGQTSAKLSRIGAWAGIAFTVLFVAGFIVFPTPENGNTNPADWEGWWSDSGHRVGAVIGAYLMVLGLLAFVWFMWSLHRRLRDSGPMVIFGALFAAVALVSALVRATIAGGKLFGDDPVPSAELSRMFDSIGFALLLVAGALTAGAFVALASYHARRHGLLPGWLTTAGYVVAILQLAGGLFIPFALFPLWVLVASIVLLRRSSAATAEAPVTAGG